jgi:formylglycine-generating enzyme required for sulfatase activity
MRNGRVLASRVYIIVILLMTFFVLTGPTVLAQFSLEDKVIEKFIENNITPPGHVNNTLFDYIRKALEEEEVIIPMVLVGEPDEEYIIPTGINDDEEVYVMGGYMMATHQTTYELWYKVRIWAEENGYSFQLPGREGSHGERGQEPTVNMHEPVTDVSWRDVVVWLNALSEMTGLQPVYRRGDIIIKDSADGSEIWILTGYSGYRLPTSMEWEMAARWKHDTTSTDGSIRVNGRYWTPGTYASGATADYSDETATQLVAWYYLNSGGKTQPVGQLAPNHLGIYDMSGNVWEMTDTKSSWGLPSPLHEWVSTDYPLLRGGAIDFHELYLQVGGGDAFNVSPVSAGSSAHPDSILSVHYGFRVVRNP